MQLHARALGLAIGVVAGAGLLVATLWAAIEGRGHTLGDLGGYCPGYTVTYVGALVGLLWGFVYGFIAGGLIAWLYNTFSRALHKS